MPDIFVIPAPLLQDLSWTANGEYLPLHQHRFDPLGSQHLSCEGHSGQTHHTGYLGNRERWGGHVRDIHPFNDIHEAEKTFIF